MIAARIGSTIWRIDPAAGVHTEETTRAMRPEDVASMLTAEMRRQSRRIDRAARGRLGTRARARLVECFERTFLAELGIEVG